MLAQGVGVVDVDDVVVDVVVAVVVVVVVVVAVDGVVTAGVVVVMPRPIAEGCGEVGIGVVVSSRIEWIECMGAVASYASDGGDMVYVYMCTGIYKC